MLLYNYPDEMLNNFNLVTHTVKEVENLISKFTTYEKKTELRRINTKRDKKQGKETY